MNQLGVDEKKQLFFRILLPLVLAENQRLEREREWLKRVSKRPLEADPQRIAEFARAYRVDSSQPLEQRLEDLLRKVDVVPTGLVLAQAANESGWGTSRFSRVANNLFGEWTYDPNRGVLPANRPDGASHYVRRFDTLRASVRSYLHNLNSGPAYARFRELRWEMRRRGEPLDPVALAEGLERYSARGRHYISEIQSLIRSNRLNSLGRLDLDH